MRALLILTLAASLGGCTYDYLQRTDRVAYSAGDAVRYNIEQQTTNPSHRRQYVTTGLGKNGYVTGVNAEIVPIQ